MSPALWHLLILWMTLVSCPRMTAARSRYVSEFEYVPWLHPSRNPNCPSRFVGVKRDRQDFEEWDRPSIEIKAVLSRCSAIGKERTTTDDVDFRRKRRDVEKRDRETITNCTRKIVISMRFINIGQTEIEEKFVVIDHVLDPLTMKKIPLQNPYVIKVRQEAVLQLYGLTFESVVNAEAREEVINNWTPNYTGCDVGTEHPTCGQTFLRGKPVPFSQGFCCACDSSTASNRGHEGWNASTGSWVVAGKLNNKDATNKPCNRLRLGSECGGSEDNPVAQSQAKGDEARTGKKSNANGSGGGTMNAPVPETRWESAAAPSEPSCVHKESHGTSQTSYTGATKPIGGERHAGKQVETSSRDKATSVVDVGQDRGSRPENDAYEGRPKKTRKQSGYAMENSADNGNREELERTRPSNRNFHSIESQAEVGKPSREKESSDRSRNSLAYEPSSERANTLRDSGKKSAIVSERSKPKEEEYFAGKKYQRVDKGSSGKSGKKRKRVFLGSPKVDSPAIRPSMHLNEPLKNLSTGVLNSNRSPGRVDWPKEDGGGNLNGVMGNTSPSRGIRAGTFNEKHGRDRPGHSGSGGNEKDRTSGQTFGKDRAKLASNMAAGGGSAFGKDDFPLRGKKKRFKEEAARNYTPQKRTLKDLSCRNNRELVGKPQNRDAVDYRVKSNTRRSPRQLRNRKNSRFARRRSKRFEDSHRRRGRRKRSKDAQDEEEPSKPRRHPNHPIRVYVDEYQEDGEPLPNEKSDVTKDRNEKAGHAKIKDKVSSSETDRQDSLDKQIEEKFSRISDALKEDAMEPKEIAEKKEDTASADAEHERKMMIDKFANDALQDRLNDALQDRINDEIPYAKKPTGSVRNEKPNVEAKSHRVELDSNQDSYTDSENAGSDGSKFAIQRDNSFPSADNLNAWSSNYKSSTSDSDLVILPPLESSASKEQNPVTSNIFGPENELQSLFDAGGTDPLLSAPFTTGASDLTRALIVVDFFKVITDSFTETTTSRARPRLMQRLGGLKKNIEKAFQQLRPINKSEITTIMLLESTTSNLTTLESTTVETTRITDKAFRPPIKPATKTNRTSPGGAEFDKEVVIEGVTIPEEMDTSMTHVPATQEPLVDLDMVSRLVDPPESRKRFRGNDRRKKKRTPVSTIEKQNPEPTWQRVADKRDERVQRYNPLNYQGKRRSSGKDVKFSLEAANVDVVKEKTGVTDSFTREQRNYLKVRVNDRCKPRRRTGDKSMPRKREKGAENEEEEKDDDLEEEEENAEDGNEARDDSINDSANEGSSGDAGFRTETFVEPANKRIHHPWFVTTETSEHTVRDYNLGRVFSSKSSTCLGNGERRRNEARLRESSGNPATDRVPARILPPCSRDRRGRIEDRGTKRVICEAETERRGRRLLSVQKPKDGKSVSGHRSGKDRKKIAEEEEEEEENDFVKDDASDIEYEEGAGAGHRKRLKSARDKDAEKSKKRDAARPALKRKKKNEDRDKELSSARLSETYDYSEPGEQKDEEEGRFLDERQASNDGNLGGSLGSYETDPALQELLGKETSVGRTSGRDDNSYDRLTDDTALLNELDKYPENNGAEKSAEGGDAESGNSDQPGKDFEISLTGKIHMESDSYGRPVSISFNAAPEIPRKDFIDEAKANGYGNRFPSEPANSFIDASDTLASGGTDNANFLPDVFDAEPTANSPLDRLDDRSFAREYFLDTIRARNRDGGRYRNELDPRQRLLRLQKKSVAAAGKSAAASTKRASGISGAWKRNLKRSKKASDISSSRASSEDLDAERKPTEGRDDALDSGQDESFDLDRNRDGAASNEDDSKKTVNEYLEDLSRVSFDLSSLPVSGLASADLGSRDAAMKDVDIGRGAGNDTCFAPNATTQRMDVPEITVTDKYLAKTTLLNYQDLKLEASGATGSETETPAAPTTTTPATTTVTTSANETVIQARISYPKPAAAFQKPQNASEYNVPNGQDSKESIERKNMLAISEFVKKLETLVADTGNSTNTTGRTLIHLKKFIIVPDNRTFWSLKEFSEPEGRKETATTETVIVMGEGTKPKRDKEYTEDDDQEYKQAEEKSKAEDRDLIKEIIGSVIGGNDLKREVTAEGSVNLNDLKSSRAIDLDTIDAPAVSGSKDLPSGDELVARLKGGKNSEDWSKVGDDESMLEEGLPENAGKNADDRFLESNPQVEKKTSRKNNDVCEGNKSSVKEKRETGVNNARPPSQKRERRGRGKKKDAKHAKKKRRRKRKRKTKKGKGDRNKKSSKKTKSKWLFKRNLLMLSEEQQIQPSNEDYGAEWRGGDKFSAREPENARPSKKLERKYRLSKPQIRGGQDCADLRHPPRVDPLKYLESTHCLRFSDLWYSVYRLDEPIIAHRLHLQIYVKRTLPDGSISWKDLTNGSSIRLGTFDHRYRNEEGTMALTYNEVKPTRSLEYNLDPTRDRLLVPSTISGKRSKYSEIEGWSNEYLVVQADKINEDASECDKAGVGFSAFVGQPDRCEHVSGTCLKNQPLDYWRHDIEARQSGRAGCYFLSNFARVPSEAIKYNVNGTGSREFLALEYHSPHVSVIDVELRDDYNALLRAGPSGRLTEVHVDNTAIDYTVITALITNKGSSSSSYRVRITDCPKGLPASWSNAESATRTVSPHRDRKVALDLNGRLSLNEFSCSVVLLNRYDEEVAWREMKVGKMDRCLCVRHCECTCMDDAHDPTSCRPMSLEHYHAAGFRGPLPTEPAKQLNWSTVIAIVSLVLTALLLFLLLLGVLKWLIGMCAPTVSRRGLDDMLGPSRMSEYFEKELKSKIVVFDQFKQPVHPDTGLKSVRICSRKTEFFLNLTFFYVYPFMRLCPCCTRPRRPSEPPSLAESKASQTSEKDECPAMVCVSTYGDGINSKMEAEDTRYVIDELKKSRESLQSRSRYKRKQTFREQSSSD